MTNHILLLFPILSFILHFSPKNGSYVYQTYRLSEEMLFFETLHDFYRTAILKNTWYSVVLISVDIYSLLLKRQRCKINYDTASWQINGYQYGRCLFFTALEHKFMMETPERIRIYEHLPFIWQIPFFDKNIIY